MTRLRDRLKDFVADLEEDCPTIYQDDVAKEQRRIVDELKKLLADTEKDG